MHPLVRCPAHRGPALRRRRKTPTAPTASSTTAPTTLHNVAAEVPLDEAFAAEAAGGVAFVAAPGATAGSEVGTPAAGESDAAAAPDRDTGGAVVCSLAEPALVCDATPRDGGVDVLPAGGERNRDFGKATFSTDVALPELHDTVGALSCVH